MKAQSNDELWRRHLVGVENPLVHFTPSTYLDMEALKRASSELGIALFLIDARHIQSIPALMDVFAQAMDFPAYFGRNWDALLDLTRDLSWNKAKGYVLVLSNADTLLSLAGNGFSVLLGVLEATVRDWRDERGEYGERIAPIPFHVVFSGGRQLRAALLKQLKEPLCDHEADTLVRIIRTPGGITDAEPFRDAQRLLKSGADLELILLFLRDRGYGHTDSIYALAALMNKPIPEAKTLVHQSEVWSSQLQEDDLKRRESARKALRDLGFS